jgi:hypothetical protein
VHLVPSKEGLKADILFHIMKQLSVSEIEIVMMENFVLWGKWQM